MKIKSKLFSLLLCLVIASTSLVSCANNIIEPNQNDTTTPINNDSQGSTVDEEENLILYNNGEYTAKFIMPDTASDIEKAVYAKLRSTIKSKIKADVTYNTDIISTEVERDPDENAVLLGNTNYEESKQAYENMNYGDYAIKVINNKIVLSFTAKADGNELVELLSKAIKTDDEGCYWVSRSFSVVKQALPQLNGLPKYPSSDTSLVDCNDNTSMIVANRTTLNDFNGYCAELEKLEFTLNAYRDNVNGNYFRTYVKGGLAVTAYFTPSSKTARIIAGPATDIPTNVKDETPETIAPSLTILSQGERYDNGLGMVYLLPNGKFLIIDGGYVRGKNLYKVLEDLAPNKNEIVIAAWYISHTHGDHQQSITSFLRERYKNVKLESVLYNYTTSEQYNAITTGAEGASSAKGFDNTIFNYLNGTDTKIIKPHSGQIYTYGSTTVEILYTVEDVLPKTLDYLNTSSLVVRVTIGEHTMLALADTTHVSGDILRNMYGTYLESDMVQLAHHGTYPGYASLYSTIKAPMLIWPSNLTNAKTQISNSAVAAAVSYATDIYLANSGNVTLTLPYTPINNKQEFLDSLNGTNNNKPAEDNTGNTGNTDNTGNTGNSSNTSNKVNGGNEEDEEDLDD